MKHQCAVGCLLAMMQLGVVTPLNAEQFKLQNPVEMKKPIGIQKSIKNQAVPNKAQNYLAVFSNKLAHSGIVTVSNIRWQCNDFQKQCTAQQIKNTLTVQDCQRLASHQNQKMVKFGVANKLFSPSQLSQCNTVIRVSLKSQAAQVKPINQNAKSPRATSSIGNMANTPGGAKAISQRWPAWANSNERIH